MNRTISLARIAATGVREDRVERYFPEAMVPRIAPVSAQPTLCFIAEKVLGLPKSY